MLLLQLLGLTQFTVRLAAEVNARFTSVERITYYINVSIDALYPFVPQGRELNDTIVAIDQDRIRTHTLCAFTPFVLLGREKQL